MTEMAKRRKKVAGDKAARVGWEIGIHPRYFLKLNGFTLSFSEKQWARTEVGGDSQTEWVRFCQDCLYLVTTHHNEWCIVGFVKDRVHTIKERERTYP